MSGKDLISSSEQASSSFILAAGITGYFQILAERDHVDALEQQGFVHQLYALTSNCARRFLAADDFRCDEERHFIYEMRIDKCAGYSSAAFDKHALNCATTEITQHRG